MTRLPFAGPADWPGSAGRAADHLADGGIVAYPTETVYGLGCTLDPGPLDRLARLKERGPDRPFLLVIRGPGDVPGLRWTDQARRLADAFWPGPLTLALEDPATRYPAAVRGPSGAVAVRASSHAGVAALLDAVDRPLTSTSLNTPGEAPARDTASAAAVLETLGDPDVLLLDAGTLPRSEPSTILDCTETPARVVRVGAIPLEQLGAVVHGLQS